jgi:pteridine reductase
MAIREAVIITGAARRIGYTLALQCADMGLGVIGHYRSSETEVKTLRREVEEKGVPFYGLSMDFSKGADAMIRRCLKFPVRIAGLVNNASAFERGNFQNLRRDEYLNLLTVNTISPLQLMNDFARLVKAGFIINLLDANVFSFNENFEVYRMSKRFLEDITLDLALLYAPRIRVNAIAPGAVLPSKFSKGREPWRKIAPLKTGGSLEDIGRAFRYLVESKSATGQIIYVDGGLHLKNKAQR